MKALRQIPDLPARLFGLPEGAGALGELVALEEFLGAPVTIGVLPFNQSVTIQWQATVDAQTNQLIDNPSNTGTVSATNAVGNSIASAAVAKWEGELLPQAEAEENERRIEAGAVVPA